MRQQRTILAVLALLFLVFMLSCAGGAKKIEQSKKPEKLASQMKVTGENRLLLGTLKEMGDYVNSSDFPALIRASEVYNELDGDIHIIDLRGEATFADGHIKGAVNVAFPDLPEYFRNSINPADFDKIVLVCYSGQITSYATSLLRLLGYQNVYAMLWGMSSWNSYFAESQWLDALSSEYENALETTVHEKAAPGSLPVLNTRKNSGDEILRERIDSLFAAGHYDALISAGSVFEHPDNYYIINYDGEDKYKSGHVPGAIHFQPGETIGVVAEMQKIPANSSVVLYCNTGHSSGFATAYLRLLGYNAATITYGSNSFMYHKMKTEATKLSWVLFGESEIHDYPYVK